MNLDLFKKNTDFDFSLLGDKLGSGVDGTVYSFNNYAIKLSINYFNIDKLAINYLIKNNEPCFVKIYDHKLYEIDDNVSLSITIMEKLLKISDDEQKLFHSILSHEDKNKKKNFSNSELKKILDGLSLGLDFDASRVIFFYENLRDSKIYHSDIHQRNIMKDELSYFKMIDCDYIKFKEELNVKSKSK